MNEEQSTAIIRVIDYSVTTKPNKMGDESHEVVVYLPSGQDGRRDSFVSDVGATIGEVLLHVFDKIFKATSQDLNGSMPTHLSLHSVGLSTQGEIFTVYNGAVHVPVNGTTLVVTATGRTEIQALMRALVKGLAKNNITLNLPY